MGSAELLSEQHVERMIESARENAEPLKCLRGGRKKYLHGFYSSLVSRGSEVTERAIPREVGMTA